MRGQVVKVALAATIIMAMVGATAAPALAMRQLQRSHGTEAQQHYRYSRAPLYNQKPEQWDPWGHWGSYYGPMVH